MPEVLSHGQEKRQHLHKQLAVLEALDAALPHYGCYVVLIVCQAVQSKGCIVLQVAIAGGHELQQGRQATSLAHRHPRD